MRARATPWITAASALCVLALSLSAQHLGYRAIDHPHFVPAAQASFMSPQDLLLGVSAGGVSKAFPAAIVAQHGAVNASMPDGPIAVTW